MLRCLLRGRWAPGRGRGERGGGSLQVHGGLRTAPAGPVWRALPGGEYYQRQLPSCRGVMGRGTGPATVRRHLGSHAGPAQFPGPWALQRLSAEQHVPAAVLLGLRLSGLAWGVVGDSAFFGDGYVYLVRWGAFIGFRR